MSRLLLLAATLPALAWCPGTVARGGEAPPLRAADVRLGCFNAWLIPLVAADRAERRARMPAALRRLELDVLCLQEVWSAGDQRTLREALRGDLPHAVLGGGGLMILSRLPIVDSAWVAYPRYPGLGLPEQLARKGILEAVVATPAGRVRVVTSHLALAFGEDNPRSKQLGFLLRRLAKQRDLPVLLAADLNTWPVEGGALTEDYRRLLEAGFADCKPPRRLPDGRFDPGTPTRIGWPRPEGEPTRAYYPDHMLLRPTKLQAVRLRRFALALDQKATALSDHNLLWADLTIDPPQPKSPR